MIGFPNKLNEGDLLIYKNGKLETINISDLPKTDLTELETQIEILTQLVKDQNNRNINFINKLKEAYKR